MGRKKGEPKINYVFYPLRIEEMMYNRIKKMAYFNEMPMAEYLRRCIKERLDIHKKI